MQIILNRTEIIVVSAVVLFLLVKYITMYFAVSKLKKKPDAKPKIPLPRGPDIILDNYTIELETKMKNPTEPKPKKKMRHPSTRFKHKITRKK